MPEKRIEIVADVENIVTFETIVRDTVDRAEVKITEERIAILEKEIADKNAELEALKAKVAEAKNILALADAKKEAAVEVVVETPSTEEVIGG